MEKTLINIIPGEHLQEYVKSLIEPMLKEMIISNEYHIIDPLLTVQEVAQYMKVTRQHVYKLLDKDYTYRNEEGKEVKTTFLTEYISDSQARVRLSTVERYLKRFQRKGRRQ